MKTLHFYLHLLGLLTLLNLAQCRSAKLAATDKTQGIQTDQPFTRMAFGSCSRQDKEQVLWPAVRQNNPQLWVWLGDIIYGDSQDMSVLEQKYAIQKSNPEYQKMINTTEIVGIWDDHDYGVNDGGKEYPMKKESKQLMLDFLGEAEDSPRRNREGAYAAYTYGPADKQVKVILLDTRYFRDPLKKEGTVNVPDETAELMGEAQWKWLEEELTNSKATFHVIGSGIQIIPEEHIYEKWANFPTERKRLFELIARVKVPGVILLSGDRHIAEISRYQHPDMAYPVYEVTASGLTHSSTHNTSEPNRYRVGKLVNVLNFGLMEIDWNKQAAQVTFQVRGLENKVLDEVTVTYPYQQKEKE